MRYVRSLYLTSSKSATSRGIINILNLTLSSSSDADNSRPINFLSREKGVYGIIRLLQDHGTIKSNHIAMVQRCPEMA